MPTTPPIAWMTKRLRVTNDLERERFFLVRPRAESGMPAIHATRLFLAFMVINVADTVFAVDSVPAVLSMTQDPFIVYTSNIFADPRAACALFRHRRADRAGSAISRRHSPSCLIFIGIVIFYERLIGDFNNVLTMVITFAAIGIAIVASILRPGHA